ncbi:MAG: HxsD-like protein [Deltaproteobacteria bacterium]
MTEIRFHRDVYRGAAVDEAVKVYERHARFTLVEEATHWVVRIEARTPARERQLGGELGNYALGLTIKHGSALT